MSFVTVSQIADTYVDFTEPRHLKFVYFGIKFPLINMSGDGAFGTQNGTNMYSVFDSLALSPRSLRFFSRVKQFHELCCSLTC